MDLDRFKRLFKGNKRSTGQFNPENGKMITLSREPEDKDFERHLTGEIGIGVVPITDDAKCYFGAIDIDNHNGEPIDHKLICEKVKQLKYPLTVCRSKSGGAHLYMFGSEPLNAKLVRTILSRWAIDIGHPGVEIFPKQTRLGYDDSGNQARGNWINLPYFNKENTDRFAFEEGSPIPYELFLLNSENNLIDNETLQKFRNKDHRQAPPCIQTMLSDGVESGQRNIALYNLTVYLKKAFPDNYRERAEDFNARLFEKPLPVREAKKTIASASKRSYRYKCGEEPCKSNCDVNACFSREYGISQSEIEEIKNWENMPTFNGLKKYQTDPVRWELVVDGVNVLTNTNDLMSFRTIRQRVADRLTRLIPPIKDKDWHKILADLMDNAELIDVPDEASVAGVIRAKLREFLEKADKSIVGEEEDTAKEKLQAIMRGNPIIKEHNSQVCAMFRGNDFVRHLKQNRCEELKGSNLWMALKDAGVKYGRLRVSSSRVINVWYLPIELDDNEMKVMDFEPEF